MFRIKDLQLLDGNGCQYVDGYTPVVGTLNPVTVTCVSRACFNADQLVCVCVSLSEYYPFVIGEALRVPDRRLLSWGLPTWCCELNSETTLD